IPAKKLADEAPVYQRDAREPEYIKAVRAFTLAGVPDTTDPVANLKSLLSWPTIASKNWVYRQYDHSVRDGTVISPGSVAAVIRIKNDSLPPSASDDTQHAIRNTEPAAASELATPSQLTHHASRIRSDKLIALTVDCNATYVHLDPFEGGKIAVAEAARNLP